ncbi:MULTISPECIES: alpha/beta fold hydrolase [Olivibacter]|uniref:Alpha/beta fold hydrolase n=1 Tax=Olivibacter jilunii TaxID=985016 RepID=A0ABW6B3Z2_9SPHI
MKTQTLPGKIILGILALMLSFGSQAQVANQPSGKIKNIVLVHGAFLDGSGWEGVYQRLVEKGYHVSIVQHKLESLSADVAAVRNIIDQQDGPVVLVGHSYGGVVISEAGNDPKVSALVYIAAHAPDANEPRAALIKKYPSAYTSLIKGEDGYDYIDQAKFPADFAADLPPAKAAFMAASQVPTAEACLQATITSPAWKHKPVYYMVATADRIINPDLERFYAQRARAIKTIEIDGGSHAIYTSRPAEVSQLIEDAARSMK